MKLGDFIDLDRQLHLDPFAGDGRARWERDRKIGRAIQADSDEALLLDWQRNVSADDAWSLGALMEGAVRWTGFLLVLFGLLAGAGAAAALLRYDGTQPINVLFFLGAIVGVQLLLLPLLVLTFLFRRRLRHGFRLVRGFIGGLTMQVLTLLARLGAAPEKAGKLRADLGALQAGSSLYARVQPLLALLLVQVFGVAFNAAVIATLLFFVVFSDLTFSWGTTIQVEPERIHRITSVLSAPWAGFAPAARPTLELVEATRFIRMDGAFATADPEAALRAGGWWPFLLAATITYGLLPRLLAFLVGWAMLRTEMRRALARSRQVQALKERLQTPLVRVDGEAGEKAVEQTGDTATAEAVPAKAGRVEPGLAVAAVFWAYDEAPPGAVVSHLLETSLGAKVTGRFSAGGIESREEEVLRQITQQKKEGQLGGAAVFFEPFEPPKTDARRFLRRLRDGIGAGVPIVVFLAEFSGDAVAPVDPGDWRAWDQAIRSMGDPFLLLSERPVVS